MNGRIAVFLLVLLGACAGGHVKKDGYTVQVVEAEGLAPLSGNLGQDRAAAIRDAQKRAIESVVGVYVSAASLISKAQMVEDNITSETEGFIQDYKITKETRGKDFYTIVIKAWVRSEDLGKKIAAMNVNPEKYDKPLVSFWITENIDGQPSKTSGAEYELMQAFVKAGYIVSDDKPAAYYESQQALLNERPDNQQRITADIIVLGDTRASFNTDQGLGGLISYRGTISYKVMMASSREIIAAKNDSASAVDITREASAKKAIENVTQKSGKGLPDAVRTYLKDHAFYTLTVKNVSDLPQLTRLARSIRTFPTVKDWVKSYAQNAAQLSIDLKRPPFGDVGKMLEQNSVFSIKISNVGMYAIDAELQSEKK